MERETLEARRPIDRHIGSQIRLRRTLLGMSREQLAARVRVPVLEMEEYEEGRMRASAKLLLDIADALGASLSYFFAEVSRGDSQQ